MPQTACLVLNPFMVDSFAALFSCTAVVQVSRLNDGFDIKLQVVG